MIPSLPKLERRGWDFWLFSLAVVAAGVFIMAHAFWYYGTVQRYNALGASGEGSSEVQGLGGIARRSVFVDIDCQMWNRFAAEIAGGKTFRVRTTDVDNYPFGREVHWNSGYAWILAIAGRIWQAFSHGDIRDAIERVGIFINPVMHVILVLLTALFMARRFNWEAGAISGLALAGSFPVLDTFHAGGPDHHSLITAAAWGTVLGLFSGGGGFVARNSIPEPQVGQGGSVFLEKRQARRWFLFSGICAGVGLWVSAISMVPLFIAIGCATLASALVFRGGGEPDPKLCYVPELWLVWGSTAAAVGFVFYGIEYFPDAVGMRLEVNHPLYHLALAGGSWILTAACRRIAIGRRLGAKDWLGIAVAIAAVAPLPIAVFAGGERFFFLNNQMLWRWHRDIGEFMRISSAHFLKWFSTLVVLWLVTAAIMVRSRIRTERRAWMAFALATMVVPFAMTLWSQRWVSLLAVTLMLGTLAGAVAASDLSSTNPNALKAHWRRILISGLVLGQFLFLSTTKLAYAHNLKTGKTGDMQLALFSLAREVGEYIRIFEHDRQVVILSTPWPTVVICYTGDFKGIGSLYWENLAGLKTLVDTLTATTDVEALRLIRERKINYLAFLQSDYNVPLYYYRKYGRDAERAQIDAMFGTKIITGRLPWWLMKIPFKSSVPKFQSGAVFYRVMIFRVDPRIFSAADAPP